MLGCFSFAIPSTTEQKEIQGTFLTLKVKVRTLSKTNSKQLISDILANMSKLNSSHTTFFLPMECELFHNQGKDLNIS